MRKSVLFAAVFALAACNGADDATTEETAANGEVADGPAASDVLEGEAPGFEAVAPGTTRSPAPAARSTTSRSTPA
jgi:hypothetical protein